MAKETSGKSDVSDGQYRFASRVSGYIRLDGTWELTRRYPESVLTVAP